MTKHTERPADPEEAEMRSLREKPGPPDDDSIDVVALTAYGHRYGNFHDFCDAILEANETD